MSGKSDYFDRYRFSRKDFRVDLSNFLFAAMEITRVPIREKENLLRLRSRLRELLPRITSDGIDPSLDIFTEFDDLVGRCRKLDEATLAGMFDESKEFPFVPPNDMNEQLEAAFGPDGKENPVVAGLLPSEVDPHPFDPGPNGGC